MANPVLTEADCIRWQTNGEELRAAVAWRIITDQDDVLSAFTSVPRSVLLNFAHSGRIDERYRRILEAFK